VFGLRAVELTDYLFEFVDVVHKSVSLPAFYRHGKRGSMHVYCAAVCNGIIGVVYQNYPNRFVGVDLW